MKVPEYVITYLKESKEKIDTILSDIENDRFNEVDVNMQSLRDMLNELHGDIYRHTLPPIENVIAIEKKVDGGKFVNGKYVERRNLLSTDEVIAECKEMPYQRSSKYVYRLTIGTQKYRFYRQDNESWIADVTDSTKPVSNNDEKEYTNPSYLRGFLNNRVTAGISDVNTLLWQREEWSM